MPTYSLAVHAFTQVGTTAVTGLDPNDPTVPGVREHVIDSGSPSLRAMLAGAGPDEHT